MGCFETIFSYIYICVCFASCFPRSFNHSNTYQYQKILLWHKINIHFVLNSIQEQSVSHPSDIHFTTGCKIPLKACHFRYDSNTDWC